MRGVTIANAPPKPVLRGWSHAVASVVAAVGAVLLAIDCSRNALQLAAVIVYGVTLVVLLGFSAVYHIVTWSPKVRARLRTIDHANIFLLIAGTYTPVVVTHVDGWLRITVLVVVWACAAAGGATAAVGRRLPRGVLAGLYVAMGWLSIAIAPALIRRTGVAMFLPLFAGISYTLGAVAYALKRPRLWPRVFGYHEVFHLAVVVASALFYVFMVVAVAPAVPA